MGNLSKGIEFQEHCKCLLQKLGFTHVELTRLGGDQGADILGTYENTRYVFQCKDHCRKQGNWSVQEVIGSKSIYKAARAGVISRTDFTPRAIDLARANYCLLIKIDALEGAVERKELFSVFINAISFPPPLLVEHDYDVIKKYEEVKRRVGHVPQRCDFDATTLYYMKKNYGGLKNLIQSLSDVAFTKRPDNASIAAEYTRIRQLIGRIPTLEDIVTHTELSRNCFSSYPFTRLQRVCGDRPSVERGIDKEALRKAYDALREQLGHHPSRKELNQRGMFRSSYYERRWGTWGNFLEEVGVQVVKGIPPRFTKEEFVVMYLLVNKLLEIHRHGTPPETWAIRHALLFNGQLVLSQKWSETLFGKAEHFKRALESNDAKDLKQTLDELIEKYTKGLEN